MKQQTAVDWLEEQIKSDQNQKALSASEWMEVIEQAKQMEKEQHNETWEKGRLEDKGDDYLGKQLSFEQYYNETYNKKD